MQAVYAGGQRRRRAGSILIDSWTRDLNARSGNKCCGQRGRRAGSTLGTLTVRSLVFSNPAVPCNSMPCHSPLLCNPPPPPESLYGHTKTM
eukprot:5487919-Pleurochrysis_carterae.AAC.3